MISVGAVFRGPELRGSAIDQAITAASQAVKSLRNFSDDGTAPWVNAVFVVEGSLGKPSFNHLEFGDYSRKTAGIVVQIPIFKRTIESNGDYTDFIIESLRGANAMAFEFFRQKSLDFPLREAEELVSRVRQRLWKPTVVKA